MPVPTIVLKAEDGQIREILVKKMEDLVDHPPLVEPR